MIIEKSELSKKIDKLKSIVPKNDKPSLMGVLVQDGYLIASNKEMTVKVKLQGTEGECFILPSKAFDLIKNLPNGEIEIIEDKKHVITIKTDKIKNSYQSFPAEDYIYSGNHISAGKRTNIQSDVLKESMSHVLYAIASKGNNQMMGALCLEASGGYLNFVGLDGHILAWDKQEYDGDFKLLIPRSAVEKILSLELGEEVSVEFDKFSAIFHSDEYEVFTRLIEGEYFSYSRMFNELPMKTGVNRDEMLDAIVRAKLCTDEMTPTKFEIEGDTLRLSIKDRTADYSEVIKLQEPMEKLSIAFNSRLVLETIKAFNAKDLTLEFGNEKLPMIVRSGRFQAVVLPVKLG